MIPRRLKEEKHSITNGLNNTIYIAIGWGGVGEKLLISFSDWCCCCADFQCYMEV